METNPLNKGWSLFSATMFKKKTTSIVFPLLIGPSTKKSTAKSKMPQAVIHHKGKIAGGSRKN
jgi:hypothetical protein